MGERLGCKCERRQSSRTNTIVSGGRGLCGTSEANAADCVFVVGLIYCNQWWFAARPGSHSDRRGFAEKNGMGLSQGLFYRTLARSAEQEGCHGNQSEREESEAELRGSKTNVSQGRRCDRCYPWRIRPWSSRLPGWEGPHDVYGL